MTALGSAKKKRGSNKDLALIPMKVKLRTKGNKGLRWKSIKHERVWEFFL